METILDIIYKYGWSGVLGVACIGIIYLLVKYLNKKLFQEVNSNFDIIATKLTNTISKQNEILSKNISFQNESLVTTISNQNEKLLNFIVNREISNSVVHENQVLNRMEISEKINNKLRDIMHMNKSQRAFIIEFHNSFKNLSGNPFAKYTCTYEWFDKGLSQISTKCIALPYSSMAKIVGDVMRTGKHQIIYTDMEKMELENPSLFSLLKDPRTTAIAYNAMYDDNNVMTAMLVLEWQVPVKKEDVDMANIYIEASELTAMINLTGKKSSFNMNEIK